MSVTIQEPLARFRQCLESAVKSGMKNPNALTLSSVDAQGRPSSRTVLLKHFDEEGFVFYTNLESRKAVEILAAPHVAMTFYWRELGEQVTIRGQAQLVGDEEADAYFESRDRASQLGAWASRQSRPLANRARLLADVARYEARFLGRAVPRPPHWSGFRVVPTHFEFWVSQAARLHDRIVFDKSDQGWKTYRLYP